VGLGMASGVCPVETTSAQRKPHALCHVALTSYLSVLCWIPDASFIRNTWNDARCFYRQRSLSQVSHPTLPQRSLLQPYSKASAHVNDITVLGLSSYSVSLMLIGDGLPGFNPPTMFFFVIQAAGLIAERMFRQVTGRKVGGIWGNVWVIAFLLITVQPMAEVWINRGYLETSPIRPEFSVMEAIRLWRNA